MTSKVLNFIFTGQDRLSPVAARAGKNTTASGHMIGAAMAGAAVAISAALVPALISSVDAANHANKVADQTAAVLRSTGNAAHVTSAGIGALSGAIMAKTGIDDEAIRTGANMLLTFTNIRNEAGKGNNVFDQTTQSVTDMAAAMNGGEVNEENMRKTSVLVGKALNDPIKGLTALAKVGVSFTAQQKEQIKAMVASGNSMGAQKIILGELTKEFGGSAAAAATPFKKLKTTMGELSETIGGVVLPIAVKLTSWASTAVAKFSALPKPVQTFLVALGGIIAVGVPLLIMMSKITEAAKTFGLVSKLAAVGNPWFLLAAAIVVVAILIITHWKLIQHWAEVVWKRVMDVIRGVWQWIKSNWPLLLAIIAGPIGVAAALIIKNWTAIKNGAIVAVNAIIGIFRTMINVVLNVFGAIVHGAAAAFGWVPGVGGKLKTAARAFDVFKANVNSSLQGIQNKNVNVSVAMTAKSNPYPGGISGRLAGGGRISGPGSHTSDTAGLFALSNDEWVIRANSASMYGLEAMNAVNRGSAIIQYRASGGGVGVTPHTPSADKIGNSVWNTLVDVVQKGFMNMIPTGGGFGGGGVQKWAGVVLQALALLGQSASWLPVVLRRMNQESGGNQFAINRWDSNALAGHPSMGLMQTIPGTFAAYAGAFASLGIFNAFANIYAGLNYAIHTYGSLAALSRPGGYALGGPVSFDSGVGMLGPGYSLAYNGTGGNEFLSARGRGGNTYIVNVTAGPLARPADAGREVVNAIKAFESGAGDGWRK